MNPMDRPTAFFEIAVLLFISFIIGYLAARLPIGGDSVVKKSKRTKKSLNIIDEEYVDPRDIITEPTTIKAVLTRDRKGNAIAPMKTRVTKPETTIENTIPPTKIAAIKKDYSKKAMRNKTLKSENTPTKPSNTNNNLKKD